MEYKDRNAFDRALSRKLIQRLGLFLTGVANKHEGADGIYFCSALERMLQHTMDLRGAGQTIDGVQMIQKGRGLSQPLAMRKVSLTAVMAQLHGERCGRGCGLEKLSMQYSCLLPSGLSARGGV